MAARALKLAGVYFMLRAIMCIFNPGKILAAVNYPPEADTGGFGGFGKKGGPSDDEVKAIMSMFTFYSIVQAGIAGLALSTARAGDAYTQSIVATGIGIISALISVIAYTSDIVAPGPETYKLLLPTVVSAVGLLAAGVPGVLSGKPSGQDIKMSGKVHERRAIPPRNSRTHDWPDAARGHPTTSPFPLGDGGDRVLRRAPGRRPRLQHREVARGLYKGRRAGGA